MICKAVFEKAASSHSRLPSPNKQYWHRDASRSPRPLRRHQPNSATERAQRPRRPAHPPKDDRYRASSPSRRISAHGARAVRAYRHDADQRQLVCSPAAPLGRPRGADARAPAYRLGRRVCRPCDRGGAIAGDGRHGRLSEPPDQQPSGARPQSAEDNRRILSSGSVSAAWSRARRVVPQSIVIFVSPTVFISNLTGDDGSLEQPAPSPLQVAMSFNRILERAGHA